MIGCAGPLMLRSSHPTGPPSLGYVASQHDGLKIVFVDGTVIYQRLNALPRIRWATSTEIIPDAKERLAALVRGVPPDTVVLNGAAPAASGKPATLSIQDGRDVETIRARAAGAGYVVIADALQYGWNATIDGRSTDLLRADHAGVAVYVPAGDHTIALHYRPAGLRAGRALTGVSLLFLIGSVVVRPRRRMTAAA
jgi:hypothetical protein